MRNIILIFFLITIIAISCEDKSFQEVSIDDIVAKCKSINDSVKFCYTLHENGKLQLMFTIKNDKTEIGKLVEFTKHPGITNIVNYNNGEMHGKTFLYDGIHPFRIGYIEHGQTKFKVESIEGLKFEYFGIDADSNKVKTVDTTFLKNDSIRIISYRAYPTAESDIGAGSLIYINNKVSEYSDYIELKVPDTVQIDEEFTAKFINHIWNSDKAWLIFGEYDENLEIVEPKHPDTITIYDGKPYYHKLKATKPGVNKITGIVIGITDSTRQNPKPFYDMYYVKE